MLKGGNIVKKRIGVLSALILFMFSMLTIINPLSVTAEDNNIVEQIQALTQQETPTTITYSENNNSGDASKSSTFTFDTWASLSPSKSDVSVVKYQGWANCSQTMQSISIEADLQYKTPVGGSYITEVDNSSVTQYSISSVKTPIYIYHVDWGFWRCKATGSYFNLASIPPTNTAIDYNDTPYYYEP